MEAPQCTNLPGGTLLYENNVWFACSAVLFQQVVVPLLLLLLLVGLVAFLAGPAEALVKSIHAPNAPDSLTAKYYLNEYQHAAGQGRAEMRSIFAHESHDSFPRYMINSSYLQQ